MKFIFSGMLWLLLFLPFGCEEKVDLEAEKLEILKIIESSDKELLTGVVKEDTNNTIPDYETISIMKGNLERVLRSEVRARLKGLLSKEKFTEVKNIEGPIIGMSPDGNMAWVVVKTKFSMEYKNSDGQINTWEGIEARLEVYEKRDDNWIEIAGAQTFQD